MVRKAAFYALLGAIFLIVAAFFAVVIGMAVVTALVIAIAVTVVLMLLNMGLRRTRGGADSNAKSE